MLTDFKILYVTDDSPSLWH